MQYMLKDNKNNNIKSYCSPFPDRYFEKKQSRSVLLAVITLLSMLPAVGIWFRSGIKSLLWIYNAPLLSFMFIFLVAGSALGVSFCNVNNFFGYRMRREIPEKNAPFLGFGKMAYSGQLASAALLSALTCFFSVLFIGYHIADAVGYIDNLIVSTENLEGKVSGFDGAGLAALLCLMFSSLFFWLYYANSYKANRTMTFISDTATEICVDCSV